MDHPIRGVNRPTDRGFANIEDEKCAISLLPLSNFGFVIHRLDNKVAGVVFRQPNFLFSSPLSAFLLVRSRPGGHQKENLDFFVAIKMSLPITFQMPQHFYTWAKKTLLPIHFYFFITTRLKQHNSIFGEGAIFQKQIFINV